MGQIVNILYSQFIQLYVFVVAVALHYQGLVATTPPEPVPENYTLGHFQEPKARFISVA